MIKDTREIEEKRCEKCKNPKLSASPTVDADIAILIHDKIRQKQNIWLATDLHLWKRPTKDSKNVNKRSDFDKIINQLMAIPNGDLLIFLGDLTDGEAAAFDEVSQELKAVMKNIKCDKIMTMGNNDLLPKLFYKQCGFKYVVDKFIVDDIVYSHYPIENDCKLNIHGHLHGYKTYLIPYTNQIDVFNIDRKPVLLLDIIKMQPEYAKHIKVVTPKDQTVTESFFDNIQSEYDKFYQYEILHLDPYDD